MGSLHHSTGLLKMCWRSARHSFWGVQLTCGHFTSCSRFCIYCFWKQWNVVNSWVTAKRISRNCKGNVKDLLKCSKQSTAGVDMNCGHAYPGGMGDFNQGWVSTIRAVCPRVFKK